MTSPLNGVASLGQCGVIGASGDDAIAFLQGQLTNDVALLPDGQARLAAYCSAKGRMLASFVVLRRSGSDVLLVLSRDLLPQTLKRLSMFVLRAKCKLRDATAEFDLYGLAGEAASIAPADPWQTAAAGAGSAIRLYPADGVPRALLVAPAGSPAPAGAPMDEALWQWGEVRSGVATLSAPVSEAFVPQMLNYESIGGVNFKKGCYPGQEVVARSQFRGTLKRRAFLAHADGPLAPGQEVFAGTDAAQPGGIVAQAAPAPGGGFDAIVSLQLSVRGNPALHAGAPDGPALSVADAPYPLLADI